MDLEVQIQSIAISVFYGMFVSLTFNLLYPFIVELKKPIKILIVYMYMFIITTLFFILLLNINSGIIHVYFLFSLLIGFVVGDKTTKKLRCKFESTKN